MVSVQQQLRFSCRIQLDCHVSAEKEFQKKKIRKKITKMLISRRMAHRKSAGGEVMTVAATKK